MSESKELSPAQKLVGDFAPKLAELTDDVLFGDVWERADLSKRDRSLVTVAALIANGNIEQLTGHLNRAKDNGLSETELAEVIIHLAFYAGWPRAMSAIRSRAGSFQEVARPHLVKTLGENIKGVQKMEIKRNGSQPSGKGPAENFTGSVRIDPLFDCARTSPSSRRQRDVRARRPVSMAQPPPGPDPDRDGWLRTGAKLGWPGRGDPSGRRGLVSSR